MGIWFFVLSIFESIIALVTPNKPYRYFKSDTIELESLTAESDRASAHRSSKRMPEDYTSYKKVVFESEDHFFRHIAYLTFLGFLFMSTFCCFSFERGELFVFFVTATIIDTSYITKNSALVSCLAKVQIIIQHILNDVILALFACFVMFRTYTVQPDFMNNSILHHFYCLCCIVLGVLCEQKDAAC